MINLDHLRSDQIMMASHALILSVSGGCCNSQQWIEYILSEVMKFPLLPNGLANLRQVSGAKVAVASFVTETARRQAQRFVRRHNPPPFKYFRWGQKQSFFVGYARNPKMDRVVETCPVHIEST